MSVSVVNGYLCYSSCDAAKARAGKDPNPKADDLVGMGDAQKADANSPAVIYDGALAALAPADPASSTAGATLDPKGAGVDILA